MPTSAYFRQVGWNAMFGGTAIRSGCLKRNALVTITGHCVVIDQISFAFVHCVVYSRAFLPSSRLPYQ
jgi:hypothetical protein